MDHQCLRISDVGDDQRDLQGIDNGKSFLLASGSYGYDSSIINFFLFSKFFDLFTISPVSISFLPCYHSRGSLTRDPVSTQKHSC